MADESHDETEFFNQDFTTATRWEVFNARLEEIIHEWKLPFKLFGNESMEPNQLWSCDWESKKEFISYDGVEFKVKWHCAKPNATSSGEEKSDDEMTSSIASVESEAKPVQKRPSESQCQAFLDLMSLENNWCAIDERSTTWIHPIARWYGLREFVIISPKDSVQLNENQRRMLLSSIHILVGETSCEIPIFVQALRPSQNVYSGESFGKARQIAQFC